MVLFRLCRRTKGRALLPGTVLAGGVSVRLRELTDGGEVLGRDRRHFRTRNGNERATVYGTHILPRYQKRAHICMTFILLGHGLTLRGEVCNTNLLGVNFFSFDIPLQDAEQA